MIRRLTRSWLGTLSLVMAAAVVSTGCKHTDGLSPKSNNLGAPVDLVAVPTSSSAVQLSWSPPAGRNANSTYRILRAGTMVGQTAGLSFSDEGLQPNTSYTYTVVMVNADGAVSPPSTAVAATTFVPPTDQQAPTIPASLDADPMSPTAISLQWVAATDEVGVVGYRVFRDGNQIGTATGTTYADPGLSPTTTYQYTVSAIDAAGNASSPSDPASATTPALPDTQAPSTVVGLGAVATGTSTIALSWTPSTDNVGVHEYHVLRAGTEIATTTGASYQDAGLSPNTEYTYTVVAADEVGNRSTASNSASATTLSAADQSSPTAPTSLVAVALSTTSIRLTWTSSTDNIGVVGYRVLRGNVVVATVAASPYTDGGLTPSTAYQYNVVAVDAAGNVSSPSNQASVSTPAAPVAPDAQAPTVPASLSALTLSTSSIALSWTAASDNIAVTGYRIYRNGVSLTTVTGTSYQDNGLAASTLYTYTMAAYDAAANQSAQSAPASATTMTVAPAADTEAPSTPTGLVVTPTSAFTVDLTWNPGVDNVGVVGIKLFRDGTWFATVTGTTHTDIGLLPGTLYRYSAQAFDAAGNISPMSGEVSGTTFTLPDTQAPTAPLALVALATGTSSIALTWTPSLDNVGVHEYRVNRGGVQIATTTLPTYQDAGLAPSTQYTYTIIAADAAGNASAASAPASVTTLTPIDILPPTPPTNLVATPNGSTSISLTWNPSTDNVGVVGYRILRGLTQIGTTASTSFNDLGLCPSLLQTYTVIAFDAAGNLSLPSLPAIAKTGHPLLNLGNAAPFAVLGGTQVSITGLILTTITGDLGTSPGTSILGGSLLSILGILHPGGAVAASAQADITTGWNALTALPVCAGRDLTGQNLGGLTLNAGVYASSSGLALNGTLTLDAQNDPDAVFVIRTANALTTGPGAQVALVNGAKASNIHWIIGGSVSLGATARLKGNVIAKTAATLGLGARIDGRLLVRDGAVTMLANIIGF